MKMFVLPNCPYCKAAIKWIQELKEDEKYKNVNIEYIDESKEVELADHYDYYYVPSLFEGSKKLHEGAASLEGLKKIFDDYLSSKQ